MSSFDNLPLALYWPISPGAVDALSFTFASIRLPPAAALSDVPALLFAPPWSQQESTAHLLAVHAALLISHHLRLGHAWLVAPPLLLLPVDNPHNPVFQLRIARASPAYFLAEALQYDVTVLGRDEELVVPWWVAVAVLDGARIAFGVCAAFAARHLRRTAAIPRASKPRRRPPTRFSTTAAACVLALYLLLSVEYIFFRSLSTAACLLAWTKLVLGRADGPATDHTVLSSIVLARGNSWVRLAVHLIQVLSYATLGMVPLTATVCRSVWKAQRPTALLTVVLILSVVVYELVVRSSTYFVATEARAFAGLGVMAIEWAGWMIAWWSLSSAGSSRVGERHEAGNERTGTEVDIVK